MTMHGCRTTHFHKRMNPGGQFLLWANAMDHWEYQLEKSFIKQKHKFLQRIPRVMPFLQSEGDWYTTHANLLSPPELIILILAALLTSLLVQFLSQDPLNSGSSINHPVSHQAGYVQLQEEEIPRSQQLAVLFLFLYSKQGITRQHLLVPGCPGCPPWFPVFQVLDC